GFLAPLGTSVKDYRVPSLRSGFQKQQLYFLSNVLFAIPHAAGADRLDRRDHLLCVRVGSNPVWRPADNQTGWRRGECDVDQTALDGIDIGCSFSFRVAALQLAEARSTQAVRVESYFYCFYAGLHDGFAIRDHAAHALSSISVRTGAKA